MTNTTTMKSPQVFTDGLTEAAENSPDIRAEFAAAFAAAGKDVDAVRGEILAQMAAEDQQQQQQQAAASTKPSVVPLSAPVYMDLVDATQQAVEQVMHKPRFYPVRLVDLLTDPDKARDLKADLLFELRIIVNNQINPNKAPKAALNPPLSMTDEGFIRILLETGDLARIGSPAGGWRLAYYSHKGPDAGIWKVIWPTGWEIGALRAHLGLTTNTQVKALYKQLIDRAPARAETYARDAGEVDQKKGNISALVPCQNGVVNIARVNPVFDGPAKWKADPAGFEFTPYCLPNGDENPEYLEKYGKYTWLHKILTDFNPAAVNVTLTGHDGFEWSIEKGFDEIFSGHPEYARLIWEQFNFGYRGDNGGYYAFYCDGSENASGGGGKSTVAEAYAAVLGRDNVADASVEDLAGKFGAQIMAGKLAVIGQETNANHEPLKNTKFLKSMCREEPVRVEPKNVDAYSFRFCGFMVQCINGDLRTAEKSESFWRGLLMIPFSAQFDAPLSGRGVKRDYIKTDFIHRPEVREYVLLKALSLGDIQGYTPEYVDAARKTLLQMREASSTVFRFMNDTAPRLLGDKFPPLALYSIFVVWSRRNGYRNTPNYDTFMADLRTWIASGHSAEWCIDPRQQRLGKKAKPEPVLAEYGNDAAVNGTWAGATVMPHTEDAARAWSSSALAGRYVNMLCRRSNRQAQQDAAAPDTLLYALYQLHIELLQSQGQNVRPMPFDEWRKERPVPVYERANSSASRLQYAGIMISADNLAEYDAAAATQSRHA